MSAQTHTEGLDPIDRALVHARAARGWRRTGWPERSNKHVRDMLDALSAAACKADWRVDPAEVRAEVERLEDTDYADEWGAVHPQQVAAALDLGKGAVARHLRDLRDDGEVVREWDIGPHGPRESYRIAGGGGEGEGKDQDAEESRPRRRRFRR